MSSLGAGRMWRLGAASSARFRVLEDFIRTAAICFAGGCTYGVEAATDVEAEIFTESGYADIRMVRGAVTYDFSPTRVYNNSFLLP